MTARYDEFSGYGDDVRQPKKKKRKVVTAGSHGLLGSGWERYDATGLVQHYTHMKQVPVHLKKCVYRLIVVSSPLIYVIPQISLSVNDIFHCTMKAAYWMKKVGTA